MTRALAVALLLAALAPTTAAGQVPDSLPPVDTVPSVLDAVPPVVDAVRPIHGPAAQRADTAALPITPAGAFVRSVILPGWGQARFESYFRGGIYYAGWVGNWFMFFRNQYRLESARTRFDLRADQLEAALVATSSNPDSLQAQIDSFPSILQPVIEEDSLGNDLRKLVRAREEQREDWIAWSLFWLLASGIDAYVTAHLADFPAAIELRPNQDRSLTLRFEVPFRRED